MHMNTQRCLIAFSYTHAFWWYASLLCKGADELKKRGRYNRVTEEEVARWQQVPGTMCGRARGLCRADWISLPPLYIVNHPACELSGNGFGAMCSVTFVYMGDSIQYLSPTLS